MMKLILLFVIVFILDAKNLPLKFQGNTTLTSNELYKALGIEVAYFFEFYKDEPSINIKTLYLSKVALENYYKTKGFYHTSVSVESAEDSVTMIVEENAPMIIEAINIVSPYEIQNILGFQKGERFEAEKFTQSKKDIQLFFTNKSYCKAALDAKAWIDIETNKSYIDYVIEKNDLCYFGSIDINSSKNIDKKIIKPLLYIEEKKLFSPQDITYSYESIYAYEGVSKVLIDTDIRDDNVVDVKVDVEENEKPIRFQTGLGYSSDEGLMGSLGVKHRDFGGNLKTLGFDARVTEIQQELKVFYEMPLMSHNVFGMDLGLENEKFSGFKERRVVASLNMKQRKRPHSFQEELLLDMSDTYDSDDVELFPQENLFVLSPRFSYGFDTRDKLLDPKKGYFIDTQVMGSIKSAISDASYYKYKLAGGYILPVNLSTVALKADFGSLKIYDGQIPASYRFFAGGMHSNRAYGYRKLGPTNEDGDPIGSDAILNTTVEYRFDIYKEFGGVVFNDNTFIGNSYLPEYDSGYYSAGLGVRYKTPIGPLAVDVGFDLQAPKENYAFHFHIGELF